MAAASAPLSKPHLKKSHKPLAAPPSPMHAHVRHGKRPRASDGLEGLDKIRRKDGMATANGGQIQAANIDKGSSYRKGMYLAFVDEAFSKRYKGDSTKYNELVAQFASLLPASTSRPTPPITGAPTASSSASPAAPNPIQIRTWLDALTHVVSKLDRTHAPLVETILSVPWATMDDGFVAAYMKFIGALVSARIEWLKSIMERCVRGLKYRSSYTIGSTSSLPSLTRRTLYTRLHSLLRMLLALIPTLSPSLSPILAHHFPSKREPKFAQICFIDNLLLIAHYCPALTEDILGLVVERALNIDVEIQGEPEEWEEVEDELGADATNNLGVKDIVDRPTAEDGESSEDESDDDDDDDGEELDLADLDSDDEPDPLDDDAADREAAKGKKMSEAAIRKVLQSRTKLDAILKVVLDHLAEVYAASSNSTPEAPGTPTSQETTPTPETAPTTPQTLERRQTLFRTLLDIFDRTLLRTFKTRNTQFILFYLCSLDATFSDHFIGVLIGRALFEVDAPAVTRVAAAGYLASFISRAKFVDASTSRKVVKHLCNFLEGQMDELSATGAQSQHLQVFYAVAQAVFYIFCFRWKDLLDEGDGDEDEIVMDPGRRWMMDLETVKKAVASPFNPLKVCAQPIVNQFATIAHKTNFLYCYSILDTNRRTSSREAVPFNASGPTRSLVSESSTGRPRTASAASLVPAAAAPRQLLVAEEMDSFFPFDPFKLPLSSTYIDGIYRDWVGEDESASEVSDSDESSTDDDDVVSDSEAETETEGLSSFGTGLAVPGSRAGKGGDEDDVARSFEAMSLSPDQPAFGGRGGGRATTLVF